MLVLVGMLGDALWAVSHSPHTVGMILVLGRADLAAAMRDCGTLGGVEQTRIMSGSFTAAELRKSISLTKAARRAEEQAIYSARLEGWSWDRIGAVLGEHGETLRRRWPTAR
uniref:Uncharacterized protein n=1 Tax=uncultured prokaryote TaxID=198431 RepID=A0A0H5Q760_9ZZZZ|nr:hypothetical protein [uncultured prokaryote]